MTDGEKLKYGELAIRNASLEVWENPNPEANYFIEIMFPEFTVKCPRSGYPDFATVYINYIPDKYIIELKSLKLWLNKFRDKYMSHEAVTNEIYEALHEVLHPRFLEVTLRFNPRGNMHVTVKRRSDEHYGEIHGEVKRGET